MNQAVHPESSGRSAESGRLVVFSGLLTLRAVGVVREHLPDGTERTEMATAVQTNSTTATNPTTTREGGSIVIGSIVGTILVLAGVAAAGFVATNVVPTTWPYLEAFRLLAVAVAGVFIAGRVAAIVNPARGVSGGIILTVSAAIASIFIIRAFALNLALTNYGPYFTAAVAALCVFGIIRLLTTKTGTGWCRAIDLQGWSTFGNHKRSQGQMLRRYAMFGVIAVGLTGAWSIFYHDSVGKGVGFLDVPYTNLSLPVLPSREIVVPVLITLGTLWAAWRLVNVPPFADFLIATEAEMNKVSWTTRKKLVQDTIVVLVTVVVLTLFLLLIDMFWGWLLTRKYIEVLPSRDSIKQSTPAADGGLKLNW
jgi:preprotein translocase SecE subunit